MVFVCRSEQEKPQLEIMNWVTIDQIKRETNYISEKIMFSPILWYGQIITIKMGVA